MSYRIHRIARHVARLTHPMGVAFAVATLSACSVVPAERRPALQVPSNYGEDVRPAPGLLPVEDPGRWQPAQPSDAQQPTPWWRLFGDPELVRLEEEALAANPEAGVAMARLKEARALSARSEAARLPTLDAGFGPTRQRVSGTAAGRGDGAPGALQTLWRAQASVVYEVDLFGRVAADVAAARADAARQQALAHQVLLLVQADVARTWFGLRQLEGEARLLRDTVRLREEALALLDRQLGEGMVAREVLDQAQAELSAARAEQLAVHQQAALARHALATLLGRAPAAYHPAPEPLAGIAVRLPPGLPSSLLERRPDIAAAERAMAAENARIGVARAAFFPALSLTGSLGYESADLSNLGKWTQRTFLFGPLVGTALSMPLFDGGLRKAELFRARARYEGAVAAYRGAVLQAFREVEDALVSIRMLDERLVHQRRAVEASARVALSARSRFGEGDVGYLVVVDAERTLLRARQSLIQFEGERARAGVDLVRALGGGWDAREAAQAGPAR